MRTISIFTILIFYYGFALGQETARQRTNQIKLSPLRIIDLVNPGFEISFEKVYGANLSSQISVSLMSDPFKLTQFTNYKGFRFSFEEKFFKNSSNNKRDYYSIEPVYLKLNYSDEGLFIKDTALNTPEYWDTFKVSKQTFTLNFKYGIQFNFNRFIIDGSIGLGIKYKVVNRSQMIDEKAYQVGPRHPNAYYEASKAGNYIRPNVPMNIKIGYRF
jgi:hypothetical protein